MEVFGSSHWAIAPEVREALDRGAAVVALESTIISHGLPYPQNLEVAHRLDAAVRRSGAVPAVVAVAEGRVQVGVSEEVLEALAVGKGVAKVSRRDFGVVLARGGLGATTVSGTLIGARAAGIRVFATGGIGGVHRGVADTWDISADIPELAQSPVAVVSAGAKSILDLPKTLEALETAGVPVLGYRTEEFPAFFSRRSGCALEHRVESPEEVAAILRAHWGMGLTGGVLVAQPLPESEALDAEEMERAIAVALEDAGRQGVTGKALTPFLLAALRAATGGASLAANLTLVEQNAALAGEIAQAIAGAAVS